MDRIVRRAADTKVDWAIQPGRYDHRTTTCSRLGLEQDRAGLNNLNQIWRKRNPYEGGQRPRSSIPKLVGNMKPVQHRPLTPRGRRSRKTSSRYS